MPERSRRVEVLGKSQYRAGSSHAGCASVSFVEVSKHRPSAWHCQWWVGWSGHFLFLKKFLLSFDAARRTSLEELLGRMQARLKPGVEELRFYFICRRRQRPMRWFWVHKVRKRQRERESNYMGPGNCAGWGEMTPVSQTLVVSSGSSTSYSGWVTRILCTPVFSSVRWAVWLGSLLLWGFKHNNLLWKGARAEPFSRRHRGSL